MPCETYPTPIFLKNYKLFFQIKIGYVEDEGSFNLLRLFSNHFLSISLVYASLYASLLTSVFWMRICGFEVAHHKIFERNGTIPINQVLWWYRATENFHLRVVPDNSTCGTFYTSSNSQNLSMYPLFPIFIGGCYP